MACHGTLALSALSLMFYNQGILAISGSRSAFKCILSHYLCLVLWGWKFAWQVTKFGPEGYSNIVDFSGSFEQTWLVKSEAANMSDNFYPSFDLLIGQLSEVVRYAPNLNLNFPFRNFKSLLWAAFWIFQFTTKSDFIKSKNWSESKFTMKVREWF